MPTSPFRPFAALLGALLVATAGCAGDAPTESGPTSGRVAVYLKDAPGDILQAVVTIDQVYLQGEAGRVVLRDDDFTVDLLTLADSVATLVPETGIPAGRYSGLHFVISGGYVEAENADGTTSLHATRGYPGLPQGTTVVAGTLEMPSYAQSGLKVQFPASLEVGEATEHLLVDFDVRQSFGHVTDKTTRWTMAPVLIGALLPAPPE